MVGIPQYVSLSILQKLSMVSRLLGILTLICSCLEYLTNTEVETSGILMEPLEIILNFPYPAFQDTLFYMDTGCHNSVWHTKSVHVVLTVTLIY